MNHIDWPAGSPAPHGGARVRLWLLHHPQVSGQRTDLWESSNGMASMIVGARSATWAATRYADTIWYAIGGKWLIRHMYVTVAEVNPADGTVSDQAVWVRVTLHRSGSTEVATGDTYASVKFNPTSEDND